MAAQNGGTVVDERRRTCRRPRTACTIWDSDGTKVGISTVAVAVAGGCFGGGARCRSRGRRHLKERGREDRIEVS